MISVGELKSNDKKAPITLLIAWKPSEYRGYSMIVDRLLMNARGPFGLDIYLFDLSPQVLLLKLSLSAEDLFGGEAEIDI
jgi:hypothetical protein